MLSPVNIDFDPSNGSWNVFALEVIQEKSEESWELQPYAFPTMLAAMSFVQPHLLRPLKQLSAGGMWYGDLKRDSPLGKTTVRIAQLVMVLK